MKLVLIASAAVLTLSGTLASAQSSSAGWHRHRRQQRGSLAESACNSSRCHPRQHRFDRHGTRQFDERRRTRQWFGPHAIGAERCNRLAQQQRREHRRRQLREFQQSRPALRRVESMFPQPMALLRGTGGQTGSS
ncbi:hypothetical protein [Bradyrhizobium oligotrophicum]|uniref:hypothetical protein n=1 Tax=Bradyrhizobium oligotrophicum TaxID=44255 RepID=UPI001FCAC1A4|nr:hypothetical protein [Bradyrhizobium oligotrophicum]